MNTKILSSKIVIDSGLIVVNLLMPLALNKALSLLIKCENIMLLIIKLIMVNIINIISTNFSVFLFFELYH